MSRSFVSSGNQEKNNTLAVEVDSVAQMLLDRPEINSWTQAEVLSWLEKSGLDKVDEGLEAMFTRNQGDG